MDFDISDQPDAVHIQRLLSSETGVRNATVLTHQEYQNENITPPEWYQSNSNYFSIRITLYTGSEPPFIKTLHDIIHATSQNLQVQYIQSEEIAYLCPTTNSFPSLHSLIE